MGFAPSFFLAKTARKKRGRRNGNRHIMVNSRPTIVVLGASGGVAHAFLQILPDSRHEMSSLWLIDKSDAVTRSPHLAHSKLAYTFIQADVNDSLPAILLTVRSKDNLVIVLDLTDQPTHPILSVVDFHGGHYINCSLNADVTTMNDYLPTLEQFCRKYRNGSHLVGIGMNPGIVNHMALSAIERYGVPNSYVEIEYDSAFPEVDPGTPFITWSKRQFLVESVIDPSGYCGEGGKYIELDAPAISNPVSTQTHLSPIATLDEYPLGMIVSHDEILSLSQLLGIPGQFVYAIHPLSLKRLRTIHSQYGTVAEAELTMLDNTTIPLDGSDKIGVWLNYTESRVCRWCEVFHKDITGTNATLFMVAVGVLAHLLDFIQTHPRRPGVSNVDGMNTSTLLKMVNKHIRINEFIEDAYPYARDANVPRRSSR